MSDELPNLDGNETYLGSVVKQRPSMFLPELWRAWRALLELTLVDPHARCGDVIFEVKSPDSVRLTIKSLDMPSDIGHFVELLSENWVGGSWHLPHACWRGGAFLSVINQFSKSLDIRVMDNGLPRIFAYENGERRPVQKGEPDVFDAGLDVEVTFQPRLTWPGAMDGLYGLVAEFAGFFRMPIVCVMNGACRDYFYSNLCEFYTERTTSEPDRFLMATRENRQFAVVGTSNGIRADSVFINGFAGKCWEAKWVRTELQRRGKELPGTIWLLYRGNPSQAIGATSDYFVKKSLMPFLEDIASSSWLSRRDFDNLW